MQNTTRNMWANNKGFRMEDFIKPDPAAHIPDHELAGHERVGKYNARITRHDHRGVDPTVNITTPDSDTEDEARTHALDVARKTPGATHVTISRMCRETGLHRGLYGEPVAWIVLAEITEEAANEQDTDATEDTPKAGRAKRRAMRRTRRATLRQRSASTRAAAKIRREGAATLTTHCVAAGLPVREARTVASSLRKNAPKAGVTGTAGVSYTKGHARQCRRYTPAEVAAIAVIYRPRKSAYKAAAARLALAA